MHLIKEKWKKDDYYEFISYLFKIQDNKYKNFNKRLIPDDNINIIGIRIPILKKIAKEISKGNYNDFLKLIDYKYYEETIIYGYIISNLKNIEKIITNLDIFVDKIDNWACCDTVASSLKIINKNKDCFFNYIKVKIKNDNFWIKRFCFVLLLSYFIEENYLKDIFRLCEKYNTKDYYVNMSVAWLISICFIKYKNPTLVFLNNNKLDNFTHNKTIQKIIESKRINNKEEIKKLKRI